MYGQLVISIYLLGRRKEVPVAAEPTALQKRLKVRMTGPTEPRSESLWARAAVFPVLRENVLVPFASQLPIAYTSGTSLSNAESHAVSPQRLPADRTHSVLNHPDHSLLSQPITLQSHPVRTMERASCFGRVNSATETPETLCSIMVQYTRDVRGLCE